jgi:hypothetical protein
MAAIVITAFLISLVAGMFTINVAKANFIPTEEPSIPPIIIIQSPLNITYDQNEVWLNFTVYVTPVWSGSYHLVDVYYECDGKPVHFNVAPLAVNPSFFGNLTGLTRGAHNLTAYAYGTGLYYTNSSSHETATYSLTGNQTVIFTIDKDLEATT